MSLSAMARSAADLEPGETTPLIQVRQDLQSNTYRGHYFTVYTPQRPVDSQRRYATPEMLRYNIRGASTPYSFLRLGGTAFASLGLWLHVLGYVALAILTGAALLLSCSHPEQIDAMKVRELVEYFAVLVGLLLVFYLAVVVKRWWAMRMEGIGGLWNAVSDLAMVMAVHFPKSDGLDREIKDLVLRYSLASFELTFMQAQGTDGVLKDLVDQKILMPDEKGKLEELVSKPQAMWIWIAGIFQHLSESNLRYRDLPLGVINKICARARASVGRGQGVFAYLDTQLPFSYVHFLSVLVHVNNVALAMKSGVLAAIAIHNLRRSEDKGPVSDAQNIQVLVLQVLFVIFGTALYHGVLTTAAVLGDPFGDNFEDFPRRAFHLKMKAECHALHAAAEDLPPACKTAIDKIDEVQCCVSPTNELDGLSD